MPVRATHAEAMTTIQLAVLDLNLPDGSGLDLWDQLRDRHPGLTVVILSAENTRERVLQALDRGPAGFIPKSSDRAVMLQAFRLVLAEASIFPRRPCRSVAVTPDLPAAHLPAAARLPSEDLGLTARQLEVLALMMQGKSNKWICRRLDLAEPTVKHHVTAILKASPGRDEQDGSRRRRVTAGARAARRQLIVAGAATA